MKLKDELMIDIYRSGALESQHIGSMVAVEKEIRRNPGNSGFKP
jgi:hypothetical protein